MARLTSGSVVLLAIVVAVLVADSSKAGPPDKVVMCHVDDDGQLIQITIAAPGAANHLKRHPHDSMGECTNNCSFGQQCDDGNPCTQDLCEGNACDFSQPTDCDDGNVCTSYDCFPDQGCVMKTAEQDGNACEEAGQPPGACRDGECVAGDLPVFDCTEQGILAAIEGGAGALACEGATTVTTTEPIVINNDVILDGVDNLVLRGSGTHTVFVVPQGLTAELRRMTITGGGGVDFGGGLYNEGTLKLAHSSVSQNTAAVAGGGVYNTGTLILTNTRVHGNSPDSVDYGGGIFNSGTAEIKNASVIGNIANISGGGIYNEGTLTLTDSNVSANVAADGGGIYSSGELTSKRTEVTDNGAGEFNYGTGIGGGIFVAQGTATLEDSVVWGNRAGYAGGIVNAGAAVTVTSTTISENASKSDAGGIANESGSLNLVNSTVTLNEAEEGDGAGIYNLASLTVSNSTFYGHFKAAIYNGDFGEPYRGTVTLKSTLLAAPSGPWGSCVNEPGASLTSAGHNIEGSGDTCNLTEASDRANVSDSELELESLAKNLDPTLTHALAPGNVAIDQGSCIGIDGQSVETDQRGMPRPQGSGCDVGAWEFVPLFPCTEQGIRDAIAVGGGPHRFACNKTCSGGQFGSYWTVCKWGKITTEAEIVIDKDVILDGEDHRELPCDHPANTTCINVVNLIVDGGGDHRVFSVEPGVTAELNGFTVKGGYARWGAGITNAGDLTLRNTTVTRNNQWQAYYLNTGGGIANYGALTLVDSHVSSNTAASFGGGISNVGGTAEPVLTLIRSTVSSNHAVGGGGIINDRGAVTLTESTVSWNEAAIGAGIWTFSGTLTLTDSYVRSNVADFGLCGEACDLGVAAGGGILAEYSDVELLRTEVSLNKAVPIGVGAGIVSGSTRVNPEETTVTITNSTISNNFAAGDGTIYEAPYEPVPSGTGAGIFNYREGATLVLSHVTLADNIASSGSAIYNSGSVSVGSTLIKGDCAGPNSVTSGYHNIESPGDTCGLLSGDPTNGDWVDVSESLLLLGPLQNNGGPSQTHAIAAQSVAFGQGACVDANSDPVLTDQRGLRRPQNGSCDVGAVEYECGDCQDLTVCTVDWCDADGGCRTTPVADGTRCQDYKYVLGLCIGGTCVEARGGDFSHLDLSGLDLSGMNFTGTNFDGANLDGANLVGSIFVNAKLSGAFLRSADLSEARLYGANLHGANLNGATLVDAILSDAYLRWALLEGADLTRTRLYGVDFNHANLLFAVYTDASFSGATHRFTTFPDVGFDPAAEGMIDENPYYCYPRWDRILEEYVEQCNPVLNFYCPVDECPPDETCFSDHYCHPTDCQYEGCNWTTQYCLVEYGTGQCVNYYP